MLRGGHRRERAGMARDEAGTGAWGRTAGALPCRPSARVCMPYPLGTQQAPRTLPICGQQTEGIESEPRAPDAQSCGASPRSPGRPDGDRRQRGGGRCQFLAALPPEINRHDCMGGVGGCCFVRAAVWAGDTTSRCLFTDTLGIGGREHQQVMGRVLPTTPAGVRRGSGPPREGPAWHPPSPSQQRGSACRPPKATQPAAAALTGAPHVAAAEEDEHECRVDQRHEGEVGQAGLEHQPPADGARRGAQHGSWSEQQQQGCRADQLHPNQRCGMMHEGQKISCSWVPCSPPPA